MKPWFGTLLLCFVASHAALAAGHAPPVDTARDRKPHWSFIAPTLPAVPKVRNTRWPRNPIDHFVLARLEKEKIQPAPEADRATLIRRLSFDIIGLPPKPEEVRAFVADRSPDAYERLVDRLLASPHYGEQWGRHWLDLARYADSDGYEKDSVRPYAYLYRDWVIDAVNRDVPFDQFTLEQLAGDLLPDATESQKIATGFHRQTLTNKEGGVDQEEFRCKAVVDRVNTTSAVWLGLTAGCAECHDHKYDPISQREFYRFYAFFNNASEKELHAPRPDELAHYQEQKETWDTRRAELQAKLSELTDQTNSAAWTNLNRILEKHLKNEPKFPPTKAAVLAEETTPRDTRVHIRGDFLRRGDAVPPGTFAVLHRFTPRNVERPDRLDLARWLVDPANPLTSRVTVNRIWRHLFGRGLVTTMEDFGTRGEAPLHPELLDWLAVIFVARHPLTPSLSPSGGEGARRAGEWAEPAPGLAWSQKALIKLIVTSATYRQSSRVRPDLVERDAVNALLARQNRFRLEAENVRDACLAVSGLLNPFIGGPSVRPPMPADIAAIGYADSIKWKESEGPDKYRRGLYTFFQRTVPYPMLTTFDAPDSNLTCTRRERSNTPLQALTLLNDPVFFECAQALGRKLASEPATGAEERIARAFELCLARPPTPAEMKRLKTYHDLQTRLLRAHPESAPKIAGNPGLAPDQAVEMATLAAVARTIMNLDEFVTRE